MLIGTIGIDYVQQLLGVSTQSEGGSIALFRSNGTMLAHSPPVPLEAMQGREAAFRVSLSGIMRGVIRRNRVIDGWIACRRPVLCRDILVSCDVRAAQRHSGRLKSECGLARDHRVPGCLATASIAVLAIRRFGNEQRLEAASTALQVESERARAKQEIARRHARYRMVLDNMSQGLMMFDLSSRLLLANAAIYTLLGFLPRTLQPGMTPADIAQALVAISQIPQGNVKAAAGHDDGGKILLCPPAYPDSYGDCARP